VLFFISVGMLFDPTIILKAPGPLFLTVFIVIIGKSIAAFLIVRVLRGSTGAALTIAASLAQMGEFSFILTELGISLKLLPDEGRALIVGGSIISIVLNPVIFSLVELLKSFLDERGSRATITPPIATVETTPVTAESAASAKLEMRKTAKELESVGDAGEETPSDGDRDLGKTPLSNHIVLIGYGRVGHFVGVALTSLDIPFLVIEDDDDIVAGLTLEGVEVIHGNAADAARLAMANLAGARALLVAIPNAFEAGQVVEQARQINPTLKIIARSHSDAEIDHLTKLGADDVIMGEKEIARGMLHGLALMDNAARS